MMKISQSKACIGTNSNNADGTRVNNPIFRIYNYHWSITE